MVWYYGTEPIRLEWHRLKKPKNLGGSFGIERGGVVLGLVSLSRNFYRTYM